MFAVFWDLSRWVCLVVNASIINFPITPHFPSVPFFLAMITSWSSSLVLGGVVCIGLFLRDMAFLEQTDTQSPHPMQRLRSTTAGWPFAETLTAPT